MVSVKGFVKRMLTKKEGRRYEGLLRSRKTTYGQWAAAVEAQAAGRQADSDRMQAGKREAGRRPEERSGAGEYVVVCGGRGAFSADMLSCVRAYLEQHPEAMLLYGDEDVWDKAGDWGRGASEARRLPWFKPDWSPDLLESFFYFGSMVVLRRELFLRAVRGDEGQECVRASGEGAKETFKEECRQHPDFLESCSGEDSIFCFGRFPAEDERGGPSFYKVRDQAAYERWVHFCVRLAGGYEKASRSIGHVPRILFHCESQQAQERFLQASAFLKEQERALLGRFRSRQEADGICVSVVIPSKDQPDILESCIRSCIAAGILGQGTAERDAEPEGCTAAGLLGQGTAERDAEPEGCIAAGILGQEDGRGCGAAGGALGTQSLEIIVVDNGSCEENRRRIQRLLQEAEAFCGRTVYLYQPQEFHFSRMCNLGAEQARGRLLLFLNDDVELCGRGCLWRLAALAHRAHTGAVGLKLYYPDSHRIQHAGITNLPMGPVHKLQFLEDDKDYYYGANRGRRNVLAVTAACLMVGREKYQEAGGFAEELRVAFNDVDFCFRLYELGYHNVCVNDGYAYHHESLSRGGDDSPEKLARLLGERDILYGRHPALEGADPYYSPFLGREGLDTGIRPGFLTAGNKVQKSSESLRCFSLEGYRRDDCLMVRVEDCRGRRILGYGVVLGDDNACYGRRLLLGRAAAEMSCGESGSPGSGRTEERKPEMVYAVELWGQYRPDLEENMADQVHVALGGFDLEIGQDAVPKGRYRLGMAVRNRVTGLRLVNWSNRYVEM